MLTIDFLFARAARLQAETRPAALGQQRGFLHIASQKTERAPPGPYGSARTASMSVRTCRRDVTCEPMHDLNDKIHLLHHLPPFDLWPRFKGERGGGGYKCE